jgi:hypothetical protein
LPRTSSNGYNRSPAKHGRVCEYGNVTNALMKLAASAGVKWKRNGLRHAYGSFRTAVTSDIPRVSFEMGNSPAMVREHYLKLSTEAEAQKYFFDCAEQGCERHSHQAKEGGLIRLIIFLKIVLAGIRHVVCIRGSDAEH